MDWENICHCCQECEMLSVLDVWLKKIKKYTYRKVKKRTEQQLTFFKLRCVTCAKLLIRAESESSAKNLCRPDETEFRGNWLEMVKQRISGLFAMVTVVSSLQLTLLCNFSLLVFSFFIAAPLARINSLEQELNSKLNEVSWYEFICCGQSGEVVLKSNTSFDSTVIAKNTLLTWQLMTAQKTITCRLKQGRL